jgi:hypothetical protein
VIEALVAGALKPRGIGDRKMFLEATRFLPTRPGATVNVPIQINNSGEQPFAALESHATRIKRTAGLIQGAAEE